MTKNEITRLQEEFGKYNLEQAKSDSQAALASYRVRKSMRGYPHITIAKNSPCKDCLWCGGTGTYHPEPFKSVDCLCRELQREPWPSEIKREFSQKTV